MLGRRSWFADLLERVLPHPVARLVVWARSDESLLTASSLAFYSLVSLPPMVLIAFWAAASVAGEATIEQIGSSVGRNSPHQLGLDRVVVQVAHVGASLGWLSVLTAVWPATSYGAGLSRALDRLTPGGDRPLDGVRGRLLGVVLIAVLPILVLAALVTAYLAPRVLGDQAWALAGGLLGGIVLGAVVVAGVMALLYNLFSPKHVTLRTSLVGGAVAAGVVLGATLAFAAYLRLGGGASKSHYASSAVGALVLLGLWLYLTNAGLLIGYRAALRRAPGPGPQDEGAPPDESGADQGRIRASRAAGTRRRDRRTAPP